MAAWDDYIMPLNSQLAAILSGQFEDGTLHGGLPVATTPAFGANLDAFGRQRVSDTGQRVDVEFLYDLNPDVVRAIQTGAGTVTHDATHRDAVLAVVTDADANRAQLVQRWHNPYTPGNGQLIDITGTLDGAAIGDGVASIFLRKGGEDVVHAQADWNGAAITDVDWSLSQIFAIDFQSLKVGRLRYFLVRDGAPVLVHEIPNDNRTAHGYWQYANLPLQWSIRNTATHTIAEIGYFDEQNGTGFRYTLPLDATATMVAICGTVKSEGGFALNDIPGIERAYDTGPTAITVSTTEIPLLSFRPKLTVNSLPNRGLVIPLLISAYGTGNDAVIRIKRNATLTNATFAVNPGAAALTEFDVAATAVTGGDTIGVLVVPASNQAGGKETTAIRVPLSVNYAGDGADIITITGIRIGTGDASVWAGASVKEIK
jgi:hypothetical protein